MRPLAVLALLAFLPAAGALAAPDAYVGSGTWMDAICTPDLFCEVTEWCAANVALSLAPSDDGGALLTMTVRIHDGCSRSTHVDVVHVMGAEGSWSGGAPWPECGTRVELSESAGFWEAQISRLTHVVPCEGTFALSASGATLVD